MEDMAKVGEFYSCINNQTAIFEIVSIEQLDPDLISVFNGSKFFYHIRYIKTGKIYIIGQPFLTKCFMKAIFPIVQGEFWKFTNGAPSDIIVIESFEDGIVVFQDGQDRCKYSEDVFRKLYSKYHQDQTLTVASTKSDVETLEHDSEVLNNSINSPYIRFTSSFATMSKTLKDLFFPIKKFIIVKVKDKKIFFTFQSKRTRDTFSFNPCHGSDLLCCNSIRLNTAIKQLNVKYPCKAVNIKRVSSYSISFEVKHVGE